MRKCNTEGKVLLEVGVPGKPGPYMSGLPYQRRTDTALSPKGEICLFPDQTIPWRMRLR